MAATEPVHEYAPTIPSDQNDPPRFGQVLETVKDVFVLELRKFMESAQVSATRRTELPTIEKFTTFGDGSDPFSTVARVVQKYPNLAERLPHIAVTAASGRERKVGPGIPITALVQEAPRVTTPESEPFALEDGDSLAFFITTKRRSHQTVASSFVETITFAADRFPTGDPINEATAADVARVINEQARYLRARASAGQVIIELKGTPTPLSIEVHESSSSNALTAFGLGRSGVLDEIDAAGAPNIVLVSATDDFSSEDVGRFVVLSDSGYAFRNNGRFPITAATDDTLTITNRYALDEPITEARWFIGYRDDYKNPERPPMRRYTLAWKLSVNIDVLCHEENTRNELADLVLSFFSFFVEEKYYTFWGRTPFQGQTAQGEHFQVILQPGVRTTAENEIPRPGDGTNKVFVIGFSVDIDLFWELDRDARLGILDFSNLYQLEPETT